MEGLTLDVTTHSLVSSNGNPFPLPRVMADPVMSMASVAQGGTEVPVASVALVPLGASGVPVASVGSAGLAPPVALVVPVHSVIKACHRDPTPDLD